MLSASHFEVSGIKEGLQVFLRTDSQALSSYPV